MNFLLPFSIFFFYKRKISTDVKLLCMCVTRKKKWFMIDAHYTANVNCLERVYLHLKWPVIINLYSYTLVVYVLGSKEWKVKKHYAIIFLPMSYNCLLWWVEDLSTFALKHAHVPNPVMASRMPAAAASASNSSAG